MLLGFYRKMCSLCYIWIGKLLYDYSAAENDVCWSLLSKFSSKYKTYTVETIDEFSDVNIDTLEYVGKHENEYQSENIEKVCEISNSDGKRKDVTIDTVYTFTDCMYVPCGNLIIKEDVVYTWSFTSLKRDCWFGLLQVLNWNVLHVRMKERIIRCENIKSFVLDKNVYVFKHFWNYLLRKVKLQGLTKLPAKDADVIKDYDELFVLNCPYSANYYHWLTDIIPRILMVKANLHAYSNAKLLLDMNNGGLRDIPSFVTETIGKLGIEECDIVKQSVQEIYHVNKLFVLNPGQLFFSPPSLLRLGKTFMEETFSTQGSENPEKDIDIVLIKRVGSTRSCTNLEELHNTLSQNNSVTVFDCDSKQYSIKEQIELFKRTKVVVGAHGAGLTNIMFSKDTHLIELVPRNGCPIQCYPHLCHTFGNNYSRIDVDGASWCSESFTIPVDRVVAELREIMQH